MPRHVAVGGAEDHKQEVVPLQREEGGDALLADLEVAAARVHVYQVSSVTELQAVSLSRKSNMAAMNLQIYINEMFDCFLTKKNNNACKCCRKLQTDRSSSQKYIVIAKAWKCLKKIQILESFLMPDFPITLNHLKIIAENSPPRSLMVDSLI